MPREERLKCVVCDGIIISNGKQLAGNGLWKLFLSARSLKRINNDDVGCIDCRMKYLNWLKKIDGDFSIFHPNSEVSIHNIVNVNFFNNMFVFTVFFFEKGMEMDTDNNDNEKRVDITSQTEIVSNVPIVKIPIERCTKSHR